VSSAAGADDMVALDVLFRGCRCLSDLLGRRNVVQGRRDSIAGSPESREPQVFQFQRAIRFRVSGHGIVQVCGKGCLAVSHEEVEEDARYREATKGIELTAFARCDESTLFLIAKTSCFKRCPRSPSPPLIHLFREINLSVRTRCSRKVTGLGLCCSG
jgi:hypothetical protein